MTDHGVIAISCTRCGSTNWKALSAELGFAVSSGPDIYTLQKPVVCLKCGLSQGFISHGVLERLWVNTAVRYFGPLAGAYVVTPPRCRNCGSNNVNTFDAEITFGRGIAAPPVQLKGPPVVRVCLVCALSEYYVPEGSLIQLREGADPQYSRVASRPLSREKTA